jgi:hypothetical protein
LTRLLILFSLLCFLFPNFSVAAALKATIDPSELAAGTRPLGLGRAYVGAADDVYSMFQNPAGLAQIKTWQVGSMYSKLIEEVDYHLLAVSNPLSREAVGLGYIKASVGGSLLSKRDPVTDRIVPVGAGAIGYTSSVWFLSYAVSPDKYLPWPILKNVRLGSSLKIFHQALTGLPTEDVVALGHDLDLGIQYNPFSWLTVGAAGYNILTYNAGGRLIWGSGITEAIPASAKVGFAIKLIGDGGLTESRFFPQELVLSFDNEFTYMRNRPPLNHLGLEWRPGQILSVRLGLDQDAVAVGEGMIGIDNNLSAGLGLTLFNFRFDYAFHTFGALSANNTHFVSISYGIESVKPPPYVPPEFKEYVEITEPVDKLTAFIPYVIVKGKILDSKKVKEIRVNQDRANIYADNTFFSVMQLSNYGKNIIEVAGLNKAGRILGTEKITVIRLVSFKDVKERHPLRVKLGGLAALGYVSGFKDGTFRPEKGITRAEICSLLVKIIKGKDIPVPRRAPFKDVPRRHWAARYINLAAGSGLVKGYLDKTFRPERQISRAEAVALLVKYGNLEVPRYIYERPFPDVDLKYWAAKAIFAAKKNGLLDYLVGKNFGPKKKITRGEFVDILSKVEPVATKLIELLE